MPEKTREKNIRQFDADTAKLGGYQYTIPGHLSAVLANEHITKLTLSLVNIEEKRVFDIGCGDGTYTIDLFHQGKPRLLFGIDPSKNAIAIAKKKTIGQSRISFSVGSIYKLPKKRFDIAIVRGVLHHLYRPEAAISEIVRAAPTVIIVEPNGYNPILKIIEKISPYHREHEEKSYPPALLDRWIRMKGGTIISRKFAGLVPFFCPAWAARLLRSIEPIIEKIPLFNLLLCANYYLIFKTATK